MIYYQWHKGVYNALKSIVKTKVSKNITIVLIDELKTHKV